MSPIRPAALVPGALALFTGLFAGLLAGTAAQAQTWSVVEPARDTARASVCPVGEEGSADFVCFRFECGSFEPLHFSLDLAGRGALTEPLEVLVGVDGGEVGALTFTPLQAEGFTRLTAAYDPRQHEEMIDLLQRGRRASLTLGLPDGVEEIEVGLTGSADSLLTTMNACPKPAPPVGDPAEAVRAQVIAACENIGGTVAMEPGFERREDLDGDGREDLVIDYAAAACSETATLNCGSGGCTVGFFLARDEGYVRMFSDVIRGYEVFPGGFLALDLHGTACGLYGFEACRKVFDIAGDAPVLVEEIAGPEAETMTIASAPDAGAAPDPATETAAEAEAGAGEPEPVVVAITEGVTVEPEAAPAAAVAAEAPQEVGALAVEVTPPAPAAEPPAAEAPATEAPDAEPPAAEPPAVAEIAPEPQELTIVAVAPEAIPETAPAPAPAAVVVAAADVDEDGPSSRHDAGPAPAVPADAAFRGDGTLIRPDDTAQ